MRQERGDGAATDQQRCGQWRLLRVTEIDGLGSERGEHLCPFKVDANGTLFPI